MCRDLALLNQIQVTNFLEKIAKEVDLTAPFIVENPDKIPGKIARHEDGKDPDEAPKPDFNPMRRRMAVKME